MPYGAFIDLGGVEGLAHINNLSWTRVESVESVLNVGDEVEVFVQSVDPETKRIALALKDPDKDPWKLIADEVSVGSVVEATVLRIIEKGAFLQVKEGVEAYLPIGELSEGRVNRVEDVVNVGDTVKAAIIKFNADNKRMMLSIRELTREPEEDLSQYMSVGDDTIGNIGDVLKEKHETPEAEYAAMLDRLQPLIMNYVNEGGTWAQHEISVEQVYKRNQITLEKGPQAFKDLIHHVVEECVAKGYIK